MRIPPIPLEKISTLPLQLRLVVPAEYQDENRHMNVRGYMAIFDDAGYPFIASFGVTTEFREATGSGGFDLEHHLNYLNEVSIGDTVAIYSRLHARTVKRIHYMMFMVNETRGTLAATFECVNSSADLRLRRTAAIAPEIAARIDAQLAIDHALDWALPLCGVMGA